MPITNRRWYQFSLRTLLLIFIGAGLVLAAWRASPGERRRIAAAKIELAGGFVHYEYSPDSFLKRRLPPAYFSNASEVYFHLAPSCSDKDIVALGEFPELKKISLYGTHVTDEGMKNLAGLHSLTELDLSMTPVTSAGIAEIRELSGIRMLILKGTVVDDQGLGYLKSLPNLQTLDLTMTHTTRLGEEDFQKHLPSCRIIRPY